MVAELQFEIAKGDSMKHFVLLVLSLAFAFSGESAPGDSHRKAYDSKPEVMKPVPFKKSSIFNTVKKHYLSFDILNNPEHKIDFLFFGTDGGMHSEKDWG